MLDEFNVIGNVGSAAEKSVVLYESELSDAYQSTPPFPEVALTVTFALP